jgi:hypothetical protein
VQVEPIKPKLKPSGLERFKLKYDKSLSILLQFCFNFAFKFNLRRYTMARTLAARGSTASLPSGRGSHSSTSQLNLSRF